jgi:hypothetical protein
VSAEVASSERFRRKNYQISLARALGFASIVAADAGNALCSGVHHGDRVIAKIVILAALAMAALFTPLLTKSSTVERV